MPLRKLIILSVLVLTSCTYGQTEKTQIKAQADKQNKIPPEERYDHIETFFYQDLKVVTKNAKWGFIDRAGNESIPLKYDYAWSFRSNREYARVQLDGEIFFINKIGEKLDTDSIYALEWQERLDEFNSNPPVSAKEVARIAPIIKKWTDFYKLDFAKARLIEHNDNACIKCPSSIDTDGINYREFEKELDTNKRIDVDYSPNKQWYVDLGIMYEEIEGKRYFIGWDDCQSVYLIDRKRKHQNMIMWNGASGLAEGVFWKSNDLFAVVGYDHDCRFINVFDIANETISYYQIILKEDNAGGYMNGIYLKEKGIITENDTEYDIYIN
ncbi:WG repeat-containing protein [Bacteroides sp. 519]|uniref:WG repeat-containing protein n=1 Tax=Bacteroides sp. 519 TaxID=2302937 RepID=UPI0013D41BDB|nr:WG repeat-containing protein [Bacteroides sp. 519]NDV60088.1 WG repeat-containing protein [Bacteroides sp. 519]